MSLQNRTYVSRLPESRIESRTTSSSPVVYDTWKKYLTTPPSSSADKHKATSSNPSTKLTRRERKRIKWQKIKLEKAENKNKIKYYGHWGTLPDLVLEEIFQYLNLRDKLSSALVCLQWSRIIYCRSIWQNFIVNDHFMTRPRFNFAGNFYEDVLDNIRASNVLNKLISKARRLWFLPKKNLHVVCGFQTMMIRWCQYYGQLPNIQSFTYVFPCDFARKNNEVDIYGTGGSILKEMKELLLNLNGLKRLELMDLELEDLDASHVLDEVSSACDTRITTLKMVNISRHPFQMLAVASFVNLKNLYISPHNIGPDLVMCFGDMRKLRNVVLVINPFTDCPTITVDPRIWKLCRKNNPNLRIHLLTEGKRTKEVILQEGAPVKSIVYDTSYVKTSPFTLYTAVELYRTDLECIAYCRLPRYAMPKTFHDRGDAAFLNVLQECPYIHTLMIRERISAASVLLLAHTGKNLRYFYVRRNAIVLKCDWPKNPNWEWTFYKWLKASCRDYETLEREVSNILGFRWYALNDKQFKLTHINLTAAYYFDGYEDVTY